MPVPDDGGATWDIDTNQRTWTYWPSGVLWLKDRPDYVDFSSPSWRTPARIAACGRTGGIEVLASGAEVPPDVFPNACAAQAQDVTLRAVAGSGKGTWPVRLVYLPPKGAVCGS